MSSIRGEQRLLTRRPDRGARSLSLVIPAKNEARNLAWVLRRIPAGVTEVIVVDGLSTDETEAVAMLHPGVIVVHELRPGKGAALRAGFDAATGSVVAMIDADGSMDPREIPSLYEKICEGHDVAKGSRFVTGGDSEDITRLRRWGNFVLLQIVNVLFRRRFSDLCYGFMAFDRDALNTLSLTADGFEIETQIVVQSMRAGLSIVEVPSVELERASGRSNLHPMRDGLRVLRTIIRGRLQRSRAARGMRSAGDVLTHPIAVESAVD